MIDSATLDEQNESIFILWQQFNSFQCHLGKGRLICVSISNIVDVIFIEKSKNIQVFIPLETFSRL